MCSDDDCSTRVFVRGPPPTLARILLVVGLSACAPRTVAPVAATPPTLPADSASPSPPTSPPPAADPMPTSASEPTHVIVPASGEARVQGLVLTAIEVREEQYDQQPGRGDVLFAKLHVRRETDPTPSAAAMASERHAHVTVRSDQGAEGSAWQSFRLVVTGGDRNAVVLAVSRIPTARSLGGTPLKLPADQGTGSATGLTVTVLEVVEKRTMKGNSMMRVTLHLRPAGTPAPTIAVMQTQQDSVVTLTSDPGGDIVTWSGFRIGYLGGWRDEVDLQIVPAPAR